MVLWIPCPPPSDLFLAILEGCPISDRKYRVLKFSPPGFTGLGFCVDARAASTAPPLALRLLRGFCTSTLSSHRRAKTSAKVVQSVRHSASPPVVTLPLRTVKRKKDATTDVIASREKTKQKTTTRNFRLPSVIADGWFDYNAINDRGEDLDSTRPYKANDDCDR